MILPSKENYPLNNNFNVNRTLKPKEKYNEQNKNIKEIKVKFFAGEKKNISYLINKINKLFFKNLLNKLREKIKFYEKNAEQLNENNNNSKKNIMCCFLLYVIQNKKFVYFYLFLKKL